MRKGNCLIIPNLNININLIIPSLSININYFSAVQWHIVVLLHFILIPLQTVLSTVLQIQRKDGNLLSRQLEFPLLVSCLWTLMFFLPLFTLVISFSVAVLMMLPVTISLCFKILLNQSHILLLTLKSYWSLHCELRLLKSLERSL